MFSKIDLHLGYHHICMKSYDISKTTFKTRYSTYEYLMLLFGVSNTHGVFMDYMNRIFCSYLNQCVVVFIKDILIYSKSDEKQLEHLRVVL